MNWTIWFDLDDTLWDFKTNSASTLDQVYDFFKIRDICPQKDKWLESYHKINMELWEKYARGEVSSDILRKTRFLKPLLLCGMTESEAIPLAVEIDKYYLEQLSRKPKLVAGAAELLGSLKSKGFKIGVLSNGFHKYQHNKLRYGGLSQFIDYVVLSDDFGKSKPSVEIFDYACKISGCPPERSVMVGDNMDTDISGAINAGWALVIWLNEKRLDWKQLLETGEKSENPFIVDKLPQIENLLQDVGLITDK